MTTLTVADLTQANLAGTGVFDVLMRANKAHLDSEFDKNRIKGSEYATVYLGSLQSVMQTALAFLLQREKNNLEAQLLEQQIILAQVEVQKANAELALLELNLTKIPAEIAHLEAQTQLVDQQKTNLVLQALNIPKEGLNLDAQHCKLQAEFDLLQSEKLKSAAETSLLTQKNATEKAQTIALGVDTDSVVGRQKELYAAQKDGFSRDAEQKAASILIGTWNARRMTDEATIAGPANQLDDATIGRTVSKLLTGVGA